jgi:hypothetical protein
MALSATWISPLLRANLAADDNRGDGGSKGPPDASAVEARADAVVRVIRAAQGRVLSPAEARAVDLLIRALKRLLGDTVDEDTGREEEA